MIRSTQRQVPETAKALIDAANKQRKINEKNTRLMATAKTFVRDRDQAERFLQTTLSKLEAALDAALSCGETKLYLGYIGTHLTLFKARFSAVQNVFVIRNPIVKQNRPQSVGALEKKFTDLAVFADTIKNHECKIPKPPALVKCLECFSTLNDLVKLR